MGCGAARSGICGARSTADLEFALLTAALTYVPTRSGIADVRFMVDAFCRVIIGQRVASNLRTEVVLNAFEVARHTRGGDRLVGLVTHSEAGAQFTRLRFTEQLDEIGA